MDLDDVYQLFDFCEARRGTMSVWSELVDKSVCTRYIAEDRIPFPSRRGGAPGRVAE